MSSIIDRQKSIIKVLMFGTGFSIQGGITSVEQLIMNNPSEKVRIEHVPTIVRGTVSENMLVFARSIQRLVWKIFTKDVDVIHIHFAERGSMLRKSILISIGLLLRQSIILHAHGATFQEFYAGLPQLAQKIVKFLIRSCSKIIVLSESWQNYYSSQFDLAPGQAVILYNPVEIPVSIPNRLGRQQLKLVFLGRIGKRGGALDLAKSLISFPKQDKGAFDLIEAFAALPAASRQHTELVLAGNGDLAAAKQLITSLGLEDKISILTWLNPKQRDKLLASADAFILPSYHEGLPMSMLESMAWGLPVIVTPVGGIPEVIRDGGNGLLVEPGHREQLVQAMTQLIEDEALRLSLGLAARQSIAHYDIRNYMDSLVSLYVSVANQSAEIDGTIQIPSSSQNEISR
ncbi:glycosyltransferase family 4 protein [Chamaesiphon sp. OTE_20_metabat_361]|uniref:glycosyltransferase family 4 protein n=1 Tax=Chamaesiphon sp. OTE_20_metabat_361 TaxID=2964689 RepID=UPI00286C5208|nr:glycosyltransferase family 4 protein [Chamaesiphon sp. OTE_20_metabat_361]